MCRGVDGAVRLGNLLLAYASAVRKQQVMLYVGFRSRLLTAGAMHGMSWDGKETSLADQRGVCC
jgi:hypothetical protein